MVVFSFQALLSTALSGGYSQGLIHRKWLIEQIPGTESPPEQKEFRSAWKAGFEKGENRQAPMACLGTTRGLFTDAEAGEDPAQQVIGAEGASDFAQELLSQAQIFGEQFSCARQCQLGPTVLKGSTGMSQCL